MDKITDKKSTATTLGAALFVDNNAATWLKAHGFGPGTKVLRVVEKGTIILIKTE